MPQKDNLLADKLEALARNLWWTWHPEVVDIWRQIDPVLWRESRHCPIVFMRSLGHERLERLAEDPAFLIKLNRAAAAMERYLSCPSPWGFTNAGPLNARPVAYFCAELGIHESMPLYSGGLGVLAGDHLKSASDLGVPMVGVSLLYREGFFRQEIGDDGEQVEHYEEMDPESLALSRVTDDDGRVLMVEIPIADTRYQVGAWYARLGRVTIYYLDVDDAFRREGVQALGRRLYPGQDEVRFIQEIILGMGGMKMLLRLGIVPGVIHLNEGHSALAPLEYARHLMAEHAIPFSEALAQAASRTVFTTHTPVPAGHDRFSQEMAGRLLAPYRQDVGASHHELMALGRVRPGDEGEPFSLTVLALKVSGKANAVSSIHGKVSRRMWTGLWPDRTPPEIPIGHITNGVHVLGWLAPAMRDLFDNFFPPKWEDRIGYEEVWRSIESIPDEELWNTMLLLKSRLLDFVVRLPHRAHPAGVVLDPKALTIGFARRFAGYKRADLLMSDPERLWALLRSPERPVQIIFSGKAHPQDEFGRGLLKRSYHFVTGQRSSGSAVLIEDYDINVCRHLVQGVDLWLSTPRKGQEACGTSGMKVALNGGLNLPVLDGWWPEAYDGSNGFAVEGSRNSDPELCDRTDREDLFKVLEDVVIPEYYSRNESGIPSAWLRRVRRAMLSLGWRFSSDRMVKDYTTLCYRPAAGIATAKMEGPFT